MPSSPAHGGIDWYQYHFIQIQSVSDVFSSIEFVETREQLIWGRDRKSKSPFNNFIKRSMQVLSIWL